MRQAALAVSVLSTRMLSFLFSFLPIFFSSSPQPVALLGSGPFTSCLICIMNDSVRANKVIGLSDARLWPHVEKGPTAVSTGRATLALYALLSEGCGSFFFREHTIYLGAGEKRGRSREGGWGGLGGLGFEKWGGCSFSFFSSQVNPHYPGLQSLAKDCAQT